LPDDKETVLLLAGDIGTWKQATGWMLIDSKEIFGCPIHGGSTLFTHKLMADGS
jgi:hypothetical protein